MGELSLEEAGTDRHRTVTWTDPLVGAALARDLSGLEYLRAIADGRAPAAPIASLLGMSIVSVDKGQVIFGLDVGEHLYNPIGRRVATASGQITGARRNPVRARHHDLPGLRAPGRQRALTKRAGPV